MPDASSASRHGCAARNTHFPSLKAETTNVVSSSARIDAKLVFYDFRQKVGQ